MQKKSCRDLGRSPNAIQLINEWGVVKLEERLLQIIDRLALPSVNSIPPESSFIVSVKLWASVGKNDFQVMWIWRVCSKNAQLKWTPILFFCIHLLFNKELQEFFCKFSERRQNFHKVRRMKIYGKRHNSLDKDVTRSIQTAMDARLIFIINLLVIA